MNSVIGKIQIPESFASGEEALSFFRSATKRPLVKLPGFCDVHVHFREPGYSYKETIGSGTRAAAHGGYTAVCTMPNLNPVPDCPENLKVQQEAIDRQAVIAVYPYGSVTVGEMGEQLSQMEEIAPYVVAFSDDGKGVQSEEMMREAMRRAKSLGKLIVAHCEDNRLLHGGYIHEGKYANSHGHKGICSESEWGQIARDIRLAKETGCGYHVCHISCRESVEIIRKAKAEGVNVTCETAPHYLLFCEDDLKEDGRFKMNPPLRSKKDMEALIEGVLDGTVDMIATDHAPHSEEEKAKGLRGSAFGIVGLETAFPSLYTHFVKTGIFSLDLLIRLLAENPRRRFNIKAGDDYSVWDLEESYTVDPKDFLSKGKATPLEGERLFGRCYFTAKDGRAAYVFASGK